MARPKEQPRVQKQFKIDKKLAARLEAESKERLVAANRIVERGLELVFKEFDKR